MPGNCDAAAGLAGVQALKHIVVLIMENRSFDHMLGFLGKTGMDGIPAGWGNPDSSGVSRPMTMNAVDEGHLTPDPEHSFDDCNVQIFGNAAPTPGGGSMQGFVENYNTYAQNDAQSLRVLDCWDPTNLPVLSGLAKGFALCDRWFSSLPGPTLPNRAFAHFGTSFGEVNMSPIIGFWKQNVSIYQRLNAAGYDARVYYSSSSSTFSSVLVDQPAYFATMDEFYHTASSNQTNDLLPTYCFLEPCYSMPFGSDTHPNDQHPDNSVQAGEALILKVYRTIWDNDALRNNTLLVIAYDEHGGLPDHVPPPAAAAEPAGTDGFTFNRLGVRVPAILVSPWIPANTVDHTVYDHASIPATATRAFIGDPATNSPYPREQNAFCFLSQLSLANVRPKTDDPLAAMPSADAFLARIQPQLAKTSKALAAKPVSGLVADQVRDVALLEQKLPQEMQSGMDPTSLKTAGEAGTYIARVISAAQKFNARRAERVQQ